MAVTAFQNVAWYTEFVMNEFFLLLFLYCETKHLNWVIKYYYTDISGGTSYEV